MSHQAVEFLNILPNRSIIEISGSDKEIFLQGLVTQDVSKLQNEPIIYSLLLSPQGKFQYDFFIVNIGDSWLIDVDTICVESLIKRLQLFKLRANVNININPSLHVGVSSTDDFNYCFKDPRLKDLGYRFYDKSTQITETPIEIYENLRLSLGVPDGAHDMIFDKSIPLEWGMDELNAISWDKGCYMGQELTARSRYVGQVRKRAFPVKSISSGRFIIALLKLESLDNAETITFNDELVKVYRPDWMKL